MARGKREKREVPAWLLWLWFPAVLTVQELAVHLYAFGAEGRFGYPILFSLAFGGMADLLCALCSGRGRRAAAGILTVLGTLWLGAQTVYFSVFHTFLTLYSVGGAGQVLQFWRETLGGMARAWLPLLVILAPGAFYFLRGAAAAGGRRRPEDRGPGGGRHGGGAAFDGAAGLRG